MLKFTQISGTNINDLHHYIIMITLSKTLATSTQQYPLFTDSCDRHITISATSWLHVTCYKVKQGKHRIPNVTLLQLNTGQAQNDTSDVTHVSRL